VDGSLGELVTAAGEFGNQLQQRRVVEHDYSLVTGFGGRGLLYR